VPKNRKLRDPEVNSGKHIKPKAVIEETPDQQPPVFSLQYLQPGYTLSECDKDEAAAFAKMLGRLSQMKWSDIKTAPRHGLGFEKIARTAIKVALPPHIAEDVNFIAFRFSGMKPRVGYREGTIFHILWLDRSFSLYEH